MVTGRRSDGTLPLHKDESRSDHTAVCLVALIRKKVIALVPRVGDTAYCMNLVPFSFRPAFLTRRAAGRDSSLCPRTASRRAGPPAIRQNVVSWLAAGSRAETS